ncbi:Fc.00g107740.m01.CDS01 [Cosmosporella sp. VM-42]
MELDTLPNSTGGLPAEITQYKHIQLARVSSKPKPNRRTRNHVIRAAAKRYAQGAESNPKLCHELGLTCVNRAPCVAPHHYQLEGSNSNPGARRINLEKDLRNELYFADLFATLPRRGTRNVPRWGSDELEGRDLAKSTVPLPSDRNRLVRHPTLEREDAFRDANTAKGNVRLRRTQPLTEDAEVAELYRMGLLYDDEKDRGDGFSLNSIEHEEPVYAIRPAKRARKNKSRGYGLDRPLHLDLSFTDLGGDDAIAQYLMSSTAEQSEDGTVQKSEQSRSFAPLRVIYELNSSQPSFDVDTSQPPDLVSDILSDYDYFSDSDLDDLPSQREVRDSAATPSSDAWIVLGDDS